MALEKITEVKGTGIVVPGDDIDTDRIIPARFMKCVTFDGLGDYLFHDVRKDEEGNDKQHNLNDPKFKDASILISGFNFGCGSSREHAPQAIYRAGYRAVIAGNYAEIFFGNSTQLGMPCVSLSDSDLAELQAMVNQSPELELSINIEALTISAGERTFKCSMKEGARHALLSGQWDPLMDLVGAEAEVAEVAKKLPYMSY